MKNVLFLLAARLQSWGKGKERKVRTHSIQGSE